MTEPNTDPLLDSATQHVPRARKDSAPPHTHTGLRFALYARTSTTGFQDPRSSTAWQRQAACELISGHGHLVAEFVDLGCSRRTPWSKRPRAAALLTAAALPDRGFDAIVVGEYERAFTGRQLHQLLPRLTPQGVQLWLPEFDGPIRPDEPAHEAVMLLLGSQSKREVDRSRFRVLAAMRTQTIIQGRYLGGRPPYGYQLVDAGPHPNAVHAQWGRRIHRLEPDPPTAVNVAWIFAQRLSGHSLAGIARNLNEAGIPAPARADPSRNQNRVGGLWTVQTIASILSNARYTGRQVWNRQSRHHDTPDPQEPEIGERRWNPGADWIISTAAAHPGIVSEQDFLDAQPINANPGTTASGRRYRLAGLVICAQCGHHLDTHWSHGRPGYRCRHGHTSARPKPPGHPKNIYLREDHILDQITAQLAIPDDGRTTAPEDIAQRLRTLKQVIICGPVTTTLRASELADAAPSPPPKDQPNGGGQAIASRT